MMFFKTREGIDTVLVRQSLGSHKKIFTFDGNRVVIYIDKSVADDEADSFLLDIIKKLGGV